ncbi:MAG: hypothetical protein ABIN94_03660 [Ferruginibacter sp.]
MMKKFWIKKGLMVATCLIAATLLFSWVVMGLWNHILPGVIGVKTISFEQAFGILILSKILFGGFRGGWRGRPGAEWKQNMKAKWDTMTPEEREKFTSEWKNRCGGRWRMKNTDERVDKTTG